MQLFSCSFFTRSISIMEKKVQRKADNWCPVVRTMMNCDLNFSWDWCLHLPSYFMIFFFLRIMILTTLKLYYPNLV